MKNIHKYNKIFMILYYHKICHTDRSTDEKYLFINNYPLTGQSLIITTPINLSIKQS